MFRRVLVPLDGSKLSEAVLPVVQSLVGGAAACEVTLFTVGRRPKATDGRLRDPRAPVPLAALTGPAHCVIEAAPHRYAENPDQAVERREHELLEYLEDAGRQLRSAGCRVVPRVHFGLPADEIIDLAHREKVDVIVMATHGHSGLRELVQGSVTAAVVRSGVAPVLVVRPTLLTAEATA